ncbi:MAG: urease accessory protein UreE [Pseudomonadota bacterium]
MLTAHEIAAEGADESCTLSYEDRFLRRKVLHTDAGEAFLADLARTTSLDAGQAFVLSDGRRVAVRAADEPLMEITSDALLRLIWHIGNRHCPAQIEATRVLVQPDHVIRDLMEKLGATVRDVVEPFTPEGGAYGHGRTHGHDHSHQHSHGHDHSHAH